MLYSMTGFGNAEQTINRRHIAVEMKAVNGKQLDIMMKLPPMLRIYEGEIRKLLANVLLRGTIDVNITIKQDGASKPMVVNTDLALYYYQSMKQLSTTLNLPEENVLATLMRMPEVVAQEQDALPEADFEGVLKVVAAAANRLMEHREHEGSALHQDLMQRVEAIEQGLEKVNAHEPERLARIRERLSQWGIATDVKQPLDANRLEQELIYYIERMDFSEERVRLTQHCHYFKQTIATTDLAIGRKLNFILQEIGREINTLGAKANHAGIQQLVINMKDDLEKMKEQVLNVL